MHTHTSNDEIREDATRVEGVVDGVAETCVRGWAWIPGNPEHKPTIHVMAGGEQLAAGTAAEFRADLAVAGKGTGHCAFSIALDPLPEPGTSLEVVAVYGTRRQTLTGSPCRVGASTHRPSPSAAPPDIFPQPLRAEQLVGSLDQCVGTVLRGWARWHDEQRNLPEISLYEAGHELAHCTANIWRNDVAERMHCDGACGFEMPLPPALCDGKPHLLDLRLTDSGESALAQPVHVCVGDTALPASGALAPPALKRNPVDRPVTLSIVVNFYNMRREAERTLRSLTRTYQLDIDDLDYEILCVDNGSNPRLDADWVTGFGPQFRLICVSDPDRSPCAALNAAALQARGRYLAMMIDGAHVLTPGVLREAMATWHEYPSALVALRQWFVGGDQRWLATNGYTRVMEDRLFARIHWPDDGYGLFRIGTPMRECPEPWFDDMSETNCLMLPTSLFDHIGGYDVAFKTAGGGFANLDLWRRATEAATGAVVALVGEASFHQFHEGTTTNVHDDEKDNRVRRYARAYRRVRGHDFSVVHRDQLYFRGRITTGHAVATTQRPLIPMHLDVTSRVRQREPQHYLPKGTPGYLQSVWAEAGLVDGTTWLGQPTGVAPSDLHAIQTIVHESPPDAVVAVDTEPGLTSLIASVAGAMNHRFPIFHVCAVHGADTPVHARTIRGTADDPTTQAIVRHHVGGAENVLVLLACPAHTSLDLAVVEAWSTLVSHRSWLIVTGTVFGQPWLGYAAQHHMDATRQFLDAADCPFVAEDRANSLSPSACIGGYLRKIYGNATASDFNPALDEPLPTGIPENLS